MSARTERGVGTRPLQGRPAGLGASRRLLLLGALVVFIQACSSSVPIETTTTTAAPTTTTSTTTTTTVPPPEPPTSVSDVVSPVDALASFRFDYAIFEPTPEGPDGLFVDGVHASPDAVDCSITNPALIGGSIGTGIAIDSDFWFDDGFFEPSADPRSDEFALDWLSICPGAPEFWDEPLYANVFSGTYVEFGEAADSDTGVGTGWEIELTSVDEWLTVERGSMMVTEEGWPVSFELVGEAPGGLDWFLGTEDEPASPDLETAAVEIRFELTGINGAQIVRSPDGSIRVGPHVPPTPTDPNLPEPSAELAAAAAAAEDTDCASDPWLQWLLDGRDLTTLGLHTATSTSVDGNLTMINPGLAWTLGDTVTVDVSPIKESLLVDMYLHHYAPAFALNDWTGLDLFTGEVAPIEALIAGHTWNGLEFTRPDGTSDEFWYHGMLAFPPEDHAQSDQLLNETLGIFDEFTEVASDIADRLATGDPQAAADLAGLAETADELRSIACVALGTAYVAAEEAQGTDVFPYALEVAIQNLLNAMSYVEVLDEFLGRSDVDRFLADGVNLEVEWSGSGEDPSHSSAGTVVFHFSHLLLESLYMANSEAIFFGLPPVGSEA